MSNLQQVREGITKAWDTITIGWRELRELAGDALTRFNPRSGRGAWLSEEGSATRGARWSLLAAEVTDSGDTLEVMLEAPGLEPGDFELEVHDDVLVVRGEKKVSREVTRGHYYVMERAYGRFERALKLPARVDDLTARARYRRGVLTVSLPKIAGARGRRIAVESMR
jgi:HSP20 family protein